MSDRMKFRVGDRVRRTSHGARSDGMVVGHEYTVVETVPSGDGIKLKETGDLNWSMHYFELVDPTSYSYEVKYNGLVARLIAAYQSNEPAGTLLNLVRNELMTKEYVVTVSVMATSPEQAKDYVVKNGHVESVEVREP
jgi:hypothetical protein